MSGRCGRVTSVPNLATYALASLWLQNEGRYRREWCLDAHKNAVFYLREIRKGTVIDLTSCCETSNCRYPLGTVMHLELTRFHCLTTFTILKYSNRAPTQYNRRENEDHNRHRGCTYACSSHPERGAVPSIPKELDDVEERHAVSNNSDDICKDKKDDELPVRSPTLSQHRRTSFEMVGLRNAAHLMTRNGKPSQKVTGAAMRLHARNATTSAICRRLQ